MLSITALFSGEQPLTGFCIANIRIIFVTATLIALFFYSHTCNYITINRFIFSCIWAKCEIFYFKS